MARAGNEHGTSVIRRADAPASELTPLDVPVFKCFIHAGMVPSMSPFLCAMLVEYGLRLA